MEKCRSEKIDEHININSLVDELENVNEEINKVVLDEPDNDIDKKRSE